MITAVPPDMPVTIPVASPTDALGLPELHVTPPGVALLNVVDKPWHTVSVPVIGAGKAVTTTTCVAAHPVGKV